MNGVGGVFVSTGFRRSFGSASCLFLGVQRKETQVGRAVGMVPFGCVLVGGVRGYRNWCDFVRSAMALLRRIDLLRVLRDFKGKSFRSPFGPPSYLSLLAQRKVTQRKGTPMERPAGILPFGFASVGWGLPMVLPWTDGKRARVVRAPLRADPPARRRSIGAPVSGLPGRQSRSDSERLAKCVWTFGESKIKSFRSPFGPTSYLSLLAQRKVTQRKGTPMDRPAGILPFGFASVGWGLPTVRPWTDGKRARVVRAPLRADPPARRRSIGAPVSGLPGRQSQGVAVGCFCSCSRFCGHEGRPVGPLARGETTTDRPKGRAHDARVFFASIGTCCRKTPAAARAPGGQDARKACARGAFLFGYFLLGKQEKVTRGPEGPAKALLLISEPNPRTRKT